MIHLIPVHHTRLFYFFDSASPSDCLRCYVPEYLRSAQRSIVSHQAYENVLDEKRTADEMALAGSLPPYPSIYAPGMWWIRDGGGTISSRWAAPGVGEYRVRASTSDNGLELSIDVTNNTDESWSDVGAGVCVWWRDAFAFDDDQCERTYAWVDGKWRLIRESAPELFPSIWWFRDLETQVPLIATLSRESGRVIALYGPGGQASCNVVRSEVEKKRRYPFPRGDGAKSLGDDGLWIWPRRERASHPTPEGETNGCIHADPWRLPDLAPRASGSVTGRIYLIEGDLDDVLELAKADFPQHEF